MIHIYKAERKDTNTVLQLIKELADYEGMLDKVVATTNDVEKILFCENPKAEVVLIKNSEEDDEVAGFCLYFYNCSTFLCKYGIYIEDIYVREKFRGNCLGKAVFKYICNLAVEKDCGRVEWWCLDWNKPSIDFYLKLGAEAMSDWTVYRLTRPEIEKIKDGI